MSPADHDAERRVYTSAELAEVLRVPVAHVWRLAREDRAPVSPIRLGRSIRWSRAAVAALLDEDPTNNGDGP